MSDIAFKDATATLLQRLPEIRSDYALAHEDWKPDEVPAHIAYGTVLARSIDSAELAWKTTNDDSYNNFLRKAFALVEDVAQSSDFESRCVIEASLLEWLLGESGGWERFSPFFGSSTMDMARRVVERFG